MRKELENGDLLLAPGQHLMRGYDSASVDNEEQQKQQQQQAALLGQVRDRLSTTSSTGFTMTSSTQDGDEDELTPDLADLHKKFEALSPPLQTKLDPPPPDLIVQGLPRLACGDDDCELSLVVEVEDVAKSAAKEGEDSIVLPPHLQSMVDRAMQDLINDSS